MSQTGRGSGSDVDRGTRQSKQREITILVPSQPDAIGSKKCNLVIERGRGLKRRARLMARGDAGRSASGVVEGRCRHQGQEGKTMMGKSAQSIEHGHGFSSDGDLGCEC